MLVYDALTGETRRVRRSALLTWTEKDDQTLRDRRPNEPWSETLAALGGRHTQQECRRRLRFLQRQQEPPTTPPPLPPPSAALHSEEAAGAAAAAAEQGARTAESTAGYNPTAPPLLADSAALDMAGPQAAAQYWTRRMLVDPSALKTCYASFQALAFLASIVGRGGASDASELYRRWTDPLRTLLAAAPQRVPAASAERALDQSAQELL